jgi:fatty-acid desaturase
MVYGLLHLSWWSNIIATLLLTHITITIYLHCHQAHRKHPAKCKTSEDLHVPQVKGIKKVLWAGAELYTAELHNYYHTFITSAKLSVKPWKLALGRDYIQLFRVLGLVKVRHVPPKAK